MTVDSGVLTCATCELPLRRLTSLVGLRSWICDACKSIAAELGSLGGSWPRARIVALEQALGTAATGDRRCPQCRERMRLATVGTPRGPVEIDGCGRCRIAWFDRGEFQEMRSTGKPTIEPAHSSMTPQQRSAWIRKRLYEQDDSPDGAAIVGLVLGLPVPDRVEGQQRAFMTWGLCGITTLTSVLAFDHVHEAALQWGLVPAEVRSGNLVGLVTHFFVHADPFHLIGNLLFFFIFGPRVEALLGRLRFGLVILAATIFGGLAHMAFAPDPRVPLIGASGGISGVLAAYITLRPHSKVWIRFFYQPIHVPAYTFLLIWILQQAIGAAAQVAHVSAVSSLGHLGGAVAGFALGMLWRSAAPAEVVPERL